MRRARSRPSSAYLLFAGSRVVSVRVEPVLDAAGSPAAGEEGFAPAGSVFAAGVLALAAAVPAVAFSPFGLPAASNDETGDVATASAKAKVHVLFSICFFLLVPRTGTTTRPQRQGSGLVAINFSTQRIRGINVGEAGSADRRKPTA